MTKKNYIAVASIFADAFDRIDKSDPRSEFHTLLDVRADLIQMFAADNPNFDRARFIEAASAR